MERNDLQKEKSDLVLVKTSDIRGRYCCQNQPKVQVIWRFWMQVKLPICSRKDFSCSFKNASCLGKMHLLLKSHKRLYKMPGLPVISNCRNPTEKIIKIFILSSSTCYERG